MHTEHDSIGYMNLDYWNEQIKASIAIGAQLADPVILNLANPVYIPYIAKSESRLTELYGFP